MIIGEKMGLKLLNSMKDLYFEEVMDVFGLRSDEIEIKHIRTRALDSYWNNLIDEAKELDEMPISPERKMKRLKAYMWPEFIGSTIKRAKDILFNSSAFEHNTLYLSSAKIGYFCARGLNVNDLTRLMDD